METFIKSVNLFVRHALVALIGVGLCASAAPSMAQNNNPPPQDMPFTVTGKILYHTPGKITLSGGQNMEFDVKYDSKTVIQHHDGSPAKDSELKQGAEIQVKGLLTEAGDIIAKKIVIQAKAQSSKN